MVAALSSTDSSSAAGRIRPGRRRLARALTATAASGALLLPIAGTAVAATTAHGSPAVATSAECLSANFPSNQTRTTPAAVDKWLSCTGLSDGTAYADPGVTRGEAAQIAYAAVGSDEAVPGAGFPDVGSAHPSAEAVSWLAGSGIVRGYTDGEFKPERPISRDELAKVLIGAALTGAEPIADETSAEPAEPAGTGAQAPAGPAGVGMSEASAYEQAAAGYLAEYGCEGVALDIVDVTSIEGATGVTTVTAGEPATVEVRSGMDPEMLEHTAAHECMHVLQHEVSGYDPASLDAMLRPFYAEDYTTGWGTVSIYEQNAECALRGLGFAQEQSHYDVECDDTGLQAGRAIASGQDPRQVVSQN